MRWSHLARGALSSWRRLARLSRRVAWVRDSNRLLIRSSVILRWSSRARRATKLKNILTVIRHSAAVALANKTFKNWKNQSFKSIALANRIDSKRSMLRFASSQRKFYAWAVQVRRMRSGAAASLLAFQNAAKKKYLRAWRASAVAAPQRRWRRFRAYIQISNRALRRLLSQWCHLTELLKSSRRSASSILCSRRSRFENSFSRQILQSWRARSAFQRSARRHLTCLRRGFASLRAAALSWSFSKWRIAVKVSKTKLRALARRRCAVLMGRVVSVMAASALWGRAKKRAGLFGLAHCKRASQSAFYFWTLMSSSLHSERRISARARALSHHFKRLLALRLWVQRVSPRHTTLRHSSLPPAPQAPFAAALCKRRRILSASWRFTQAAAHRSLLAWADVKARSVAIERLRRVLSSRRLSVAVAVWRRRRVISRRAAIASASASIALLRRSFASLRVRTMAPYTPTTLFRLMSLRDSKVRVFSRWRAAATSALRERSCALLAYSALRMAAADSIARTALRARTRPLRPVAPLLPMGPLKKRVFVLWKFFLARRIAISLCGLRALRWRAKALQSFKSAHLSVWRRRASLSIASLIFSQRRLQRLTMSRWVNFYALEVHIRRCGIHRLVLFLRFAVRRWAVMTNRKLMFVNAAVRVRSLWLRALLRRSYGIIVSYLAWRRICRCLDLKARLLSVRIRMRRGFCAWSGLVFGQGLVSRAADVRRRRWLRSVVGTLRYWHEETAKVKKARRLSIYFVLSSAFAQWRRVRMPHRRAEFLTSVQATVRWAESVLRSHFVAWTSIVAFIGQSARDEKRRQVQTLRADLVESLERERILRMRMRAATDIGGGGIPVTPQHVHDKSDRVVSAKRCVSAWR